MKSPLHRLLIAGLLAVFSGLLRPGPAYARITPDAEHTIWIQIDSIPSGAALHAPSTEEGVRGPRIGTTPCVIAVDLKWGRRWFVKKWDNLWLWSPGDICYATLQPDSSYDLFLDLTLVKDGFREQVVDARILTLKHPGKDWAGRVAWPTQARFMTELIALTTQQGTAAKPAREPARRVIMADSQDDGAIGAAGTLTVHANVDSAQVLLNGRTVGATPLQVVLKEGLHVLEVRKPGYHSLRREIVINDDAEVAYRAVLQPVAP